MPTTKTSGALQDLLREIVDWSRKPGRAHDGHRTLTNVIRLAKLDYNEALRKRFSRRQIRGLVEDLRSFLPELNRHVFSETDLARLQVRAKDFGVELRPRAFQGQEGLSLRGFYVNDKSLLRRPLIVVNTNIHRVGVAAAFWHEMGHHLTHAIFGAAHETVSASFSTVLEDHLDQPEEIIADAVTALACYPYRSARRLFEAPKTDLVAGDPNSLFGNVWPYLQVTTGFKFDRRFSSAETLHYLEGMIHLAKLRAALLHEYGI